MLFFSQAGRVANALGIIGLTNEEGNGLRIKRHVGGGTVGADAGEVQGSLSRHGERFVLFNWFGYALTESQELLVATPPQISGQELRSAVHQEARINESVKGEEDDIAY